MPRAKKTISESDTALMISPTDKEPTKEIAEQKKAKPKKVEWKDEPPKYDAKFGKFIVKFD